MKKIHLFLSIILVVVTGCQSLDSSNSTPIDPQYQGVKISPTAIPVPTLRTSDQTRTSNPSTSTPFQPVQTPTPTLLPLTEVSQGSLEEKVFAIQAFIEELAGEDGFSGSVLIAYEGVPILQKAYGLADRSLDIPNNIDTKFNLGSMDKMFTATAIMQLVEQEKISLEAPIRAYLPDYPNQEIANAVTVHHLLTHTSGLGNYFDSPLYLDKFDQIRSIDDYFALFADLPTRAVPGSGFAYSNSGFIILGLIIEAVSGVSYYDYVRDHIFNPSGMVDTACYEGDAGIPNLAVGYTTLNWYGDDTEELRDNTSMLPMRGGSAGGGYSTAPDLLAYAKALMTNQLLSSESTALMTKGKVQIRGESQYAYGFFDREVDGHRMIGHGGGFPGICSMLNIFPDQEKTVIILSNSDHGCMIVSEFIFEAIFE